MIVKSLEDINGTEDDVQAKTWYSRRFLLRRDGMGFSMHDTVMKAGTETFMWYANHIEAVYCIDGEGELEEHATGKKYTDQAGRAVLPEQARQAHHARRAPTCA